jgi:Tfp pilus assembly protein PilV
MTRRRSRESGLTLIEILMTILIMMVGAAGLIALQAATMASSRFARDMTVASSLVISKAEELRLVTPVPTVTTTPTAACATLFSCTAPGNEVVDETGANNATGRFTRCWCATTDGIATTVQVLVAWNDNGQPPATCGGPTHCIRGSLRRKQ